MFKELKIEPNDLENFQVVGFGTGKAFSEDLAKDKAKLNAMVNLADQINGRDFSYEAADGSVNFKSSIKGKILKSDIVQTYDLGDRTFLMILSSPMQRETIEIKNAFLLETEFRTDNLEKALIEKYEATVEELISHKFKKQSGLTGKIYLSDIKLSDFEAKPDYAVNLKIFVVVFE